MSDIILQHTSDQINVGITNALAMPDDITALDTRIEDVVNSLFTELALRPIQKGRVFYGYNDEFIIFNIAVDDYVLAVKKDILEEMLPPDMYDSVMLTYQFYHQGIS